MLQKIKWILILGSVISFFNTALAQDTIRWNKNGLGAWHNKNNWIPAQIPGDSNVVYIGHDSVAILNGNQGVALEVIVDGTTNVAGLAVTAGCSLIIEGDGYRGLFIKGPSATFLNAGELEVRSSDSHGIYFTGAYFENTLSGHIFLDASINEFGIYHAGKELINAGRIKIDGAIGGLDNRSHFLNEGVIEILSVEQAIINRDSLINKDSISIDGALFGLENQFFVENGSGALLAIRDCASRPIYNANFMDEPLFENFGKIFCQNQDVPIQILDGVFANFDSIIAHGSGLNLSDKFENKANAYLQIDSVETGIDIIDSLINDGEIRIQDFSSDGIFNQNYFQNNALTVITRDLGTEDPEFVFGIRNFGDLINDGKLNIDLLTGSGIYNNSNTNKCIVNNDSIIIEQVVFGGYIQPVGCTLNQGLLLVDGATEGLFLGMEEMGPGSIRTASFIVEISNILNTLNAQICIQNASLNGIQIYSNGSIINQSGGLVKTEMITGNPIDMVLGGLLTGDGIMELGN